MLGNKLTLILISIGLNKVRSNRKIGLMGNHQVNPFANCPQEGVPSALSACDLEKND